MLSLKFREKESSKALQAGSRWWLWWEHWPPEASCCANVCQCVPLCANRIHFQVAALSSPLGNFRGLKGDKWVSAGYLLPLRPHNTPCHLCCWRLLLPCYCTQAPTSLCCASQVPTISCICIFSCICICKCICCLLWWQWQ